MYLIENGGVAVEKRGVAYVGVAHDPAQVRCCPPYLVVERGRGEDK